MVDINFLKKKNKGRYLRKIGAFSMAGLIGLSLGFASFDTYKFPNSFIGDESSFNGKIVIGEDANLDKDAAEYLFSKLSGEDVTSSNNNLVKITYRDKDSAGDENIDAAGDKDELNYGEKLSDVNDDEFDDSDTDYLNDEELENGINDESYEQKLQLLNGEFNYAFYDRVDDLDEITDGLYYDDGDDFAIYTIEFKSPIDLDDSDDLDEEFVGETLIIMGQEYTIVDIKSDGSDLDEISLIGGPESVSIKEKETKEFIIDGIKYSITAKIITEDRILLDVNGVDESIDIYDSEQVGNLSIVVKDILENDLKGYESFAEFFIGGDKITLRDNDDEVEIDKDTIADLYDDKYRVTSDFNDGNVGLETITITYTIEDETLLEEGDSLDDVLFGAFSLVYDGINDVKYKTVEIDAIDDTIEVSGELFTNEEFNKDLIFTSSTDGANGHTYIQGDDDNARTFFKGSNLDLFLPLGFNKISANILEVNFTEDDIEGSGFLMVEDDDEQYLYEIDNVDRTDKEIDLIEILDDTDSYKEIKPSDFADDIDVNLFNIIANDEDGTLRLDLDEFKDPIIAFDYDLIMDLSLVEGVGHGGEIKFRLDTSDADGDLVSDVLEEYSVDLTWDSGDDEFRLNVDNNDLDFVNSNNAEFDEDDDTRFYVTIYGTQVEYDIDSKDYVNIRVPNKQVRADVNLVFGERSETLRSVNVVREDVDKKRDELEEQGYKIVSVRDVSDNNYDLDVSDIIYDNEIDNLRDKVIIGGPAINRAAALILDLDFPTYGPQTELSNNEAVIRYYDEYNSILIYGYNADDTRTAIEELLKGEDNQKEVFIATD